jgi:hypothetical protein
MCVCVCVCVRACVRACVRTCVCSPGICAPLSQFCERDPGVIPRIDYRHFVRILVSVNEEPIEQRLGLVFDCWDADSSGPLDLT